MWITLHNQECYQPALGCGLSSKILSIDEINDFKASTDLKFPRLNKNGTIKFIFFNRGIVASFSIQGEKEDYPANLGLMYLVGFAKYARKIILD